MPQALSECAQSRGTFLPVLTLIAVKSLRIWLLVLLAFELPLRGAMAAVMLCADETGHVQAAVADGDHHDHASVHGHGTTDTHSQHHHGSGSAHDADGKCSLCASCCSATAPATVNFAMPQAPPAAAAFPDHRTPPAEFFSGGQERPPRSI